MANNNLFENVIIISTDEDGLACTERAKNNI